MLTELRCPSLLRSESSPVFIIQRQGDPIEMSEVEEDLLRNRGKAAVLSAAFMSRRASRMNASGDHRIWEL